MNDTRSKTPLVLMEQVIMGLVFALAAALCVQAFVQARNLSIASVERDHAMNISQTLAEYAKAYRGDMPLMQEELGGEISEESLLLYFDSEWNYVSNLKEASYIACFAPEEGEEFCRYGNITVRHVKEEKVISSMKTAWQEVSGNE